MKKIEMFLSTVFANNSANSNKCNKINFWCPTGMPPIFCDRMWNDAQIEVEQSLDGLYSDLRSCFRNWILQLNSPREDKKIELIREGSRFLTFNYSKTLENMYGVPSAQILHIHGCIDDNEEFVLGHCVGEDELRKMIIVNDPEPPSDDDPEAYEQWRMEMEDNHQLHQQLAEDAAVSGVASQQKPVKKLLHRYKDFFDSLYDVTHIHVYGMSFSEVDAPYLNMVAQIARDAEWEISDYQGYCEMEITSFIDLHKITNYKVIELNTLISRLQLEIDFPAN